MSRGPISHGDLMLAMEAIAPASAAEEAMVASLLGFGRARGPGDAPRPQEAPPPAPAPPEPAPHAAAVPPPAPAHPVVTHRSASGGFSMRGPHRYTPRTQLWLESPAPLSVGPAAAAPPAGSPEPPPLLVERWARNILAAAVATRQADGPLDIPRLVRDVANREWSATLPREVRYAPRGAQLLVDFGEGMLPFAADQRRVAAQLRRLLGTERVRTLHFAGSPLHGVGTGASDTWRPYGEEHLPPPGTPVLALTDLGIARPPMARTYGGVRDWRRFAERLAARGSRVVALVPYPERRWPRPLRRLLRIIQWDRATTVGAVRFRRTEARR